MRFFNTALVVSAVAMIAGCGGGGSQGPAPITFQPGPPPAAAPFVAQYVPPLNIVPFPNDIFFAGSTDGTLNIPETVTGPLTVAVNTLDGFSTIAPITAPFNGAVDEATLIPFNVAAPTGTETVFILNATAGVPLIPGLDYEISLSTASGTGDAVVQITPLRPLAESSTLVFIMTNGIQSATGQPAAADQVFQLVRDAHLAGVTTGNTDLDALLPAIGPLLDAGTGVFGLTGSDIVVAWSVSTQSISDVLLEVDATATGQLSFIQFAGITTADVVPVLPGIADLFVGFMEIPYYMDSGDILGSFWIGANGQLLTRNNTTALVRETLRIPVLASMPNAQSGQVRPAGGWPVAIYQHGVTDNRTSMIALADAMAQAGIAMVAIDLPIHGITDTSNPLFQGPGNPLGDNERHFGADNVMASGLPGPDGAIDSGIQIFNISNPLNALGYIRQYFSDQTTLTRTIPTMDFDADQLPDLDASRIHYVGLSLGSIFSGVFLGINDEVTTATLSSPAGPWTSILVDPEAVTFGQPLRDGLAAQGLVQGTVGFDNFVRDLQTVLDSGDPTNFAAEAGMLHPIHVFEILGDVTVPNTPTDNIANLFGLTSVSATTVDPAGARGIVRMLDSGHTSLVNPVFNPLSTVEMQTQMATFAATNGTTILITNSDVVQ